MSFGELRAGASSDSGAGDEGESGGCGPVRGRCSEGLMPLCDPAAGIFGAEGGGEAQDRGALVEVLASVISSLYPVALILTFVYTHHHHLLLLPPSIHHLLASLNHISVFLSGVADW